MQRIPPFLVRQGTRDAYARRLVPPGVLLVQQVRDPSVPRLLPPLLAEFVGVTEEHAPSRTVLVAGLLRAVLTGEPLTALFEREVVLQPGGQGVLVGVSQPGPDFSQGSEDPAQYRARPLPSVLRAGPVREQERPRAS